MNRAQVDFVELSSHGASLTQQAPGPRPWIITRLPRASHESHAPHRGRAPQSAPGAISPLLCREVHFALESDGWNCTFECEVHVSAPSGVRRGRVRPATLLPGLAVVGRVS